MMSDQERDSAIDFVNNMKSTRGAEVCKCITTSEASHCYCGPTVISTVSCDK